MALNEIVNVQIQAGTVSPARRGFGTPLILMYHTVWATDEVREYATFGEVSTDFGSDHPVALAAAALFSQSPRPETVKVGRLPAPDSPHSYKLDGTNVASGDTLSGSIVDSDGDSFSFDEAWDTDLATTLTNLAGTINGSSLAVSATANLTDLDLVADSNGPVFFYSVSTAGLRLRDVTADWGYNDRLDNVVTVDGDFYAIITEVNSPQNMDKVARWALANDRIAAFAPQYTDPATGFVSGEFTAGADLTALQANDQAFGLFTQDPRSEFKEAAWLGDMLPRDPGSATWAYKQLSGVGTDAWTTTQRGDVEDAGGNHYTAEAGIGVTRPGKAFGGEWIDVTRSLHWIEARMQERLFSALVNNPKIPYTDAGFQILANEVGGQLQEAEDRGVIDSDWTVTVKAVELQTSADRADRIVRGVEFQARLAGAVHEIKIIGTVTF